MTGAGSEIRAALRRLIRARLVNDAFAVVLVAAGVLAFGAAVAAFAFWSGWLAVALLVVPVVLAWRWFGESRLERTARAVEERFEPVRGRLVAALELDELDADGREGYSSELAQASVVHCAELLRPLQLKVLVRRRRPLFGGAAMFVGLAVLAFLFLLMPTRARIGFANAFAPQHLSVSFTVTPGDTAVLPGREVRLLCRVEPSVFGSVTFERSAETVGRQRVPARDGAAEVVLEPEHGFDYRFRVLGFRSERFRVTVTEPLRVEQLFFTYHYPDYSALPDYRSSSTEIVALNGTEVEFAGSLNQPADRGWFVFGSESTEVVTGADRGFEGRFDVSGPGEGRLLLASSPTGELELVETVRIRTMADEPPLVKLFVPGRDVDLPVSMQLLLGINSLDDYGLGSLYLHFTGDSVLAEDDRRFAFERRRLKSLAGREDTTLHTWDLSQSGLLPGDVVRYYVSVTDNDAVGGPKSGRTPEFSVRFPTMTEIYNAAVRQTEYTTEELSPLAEEQERLSEEVARISEEMKRSGDLSWEERKALEQLLAEQVDLANELSELSEEIGQLMDELFQGVTLDESTLQQLARLQELLFELLPRELQESLARLSEQLDEEAGDLREALDRFELDQEQLAESIEQALEMLERLMEEQRLEALARKAEDLADEELALLDCLENSDGEMPAEMQDNIGQAIDSLLQELSELAESMSDSATAESLAALSEQAEQDSLSAQSGETAEAMRQQDRQQSKKLAGQLEQKLRAMANRMSSAAQSLKQHRSSEVADKLVRAAEDLLMVVREQEWLEQLPDSLLNDRAGRQMGLHDATGVVAESLAALGGRTMRMSSGPTRELAAAMGTMQDAAQSLVESRARNARRQMVAARSGVNRVVSMLLEALGEEGGGGSGGLEGLIQSLSQMTAEQMAMNAAMNGMPIPMPGGMSPAQMQALSRLLAKQQALRQKLEEMLQSMGGSQPGLTSSLEGLVDEMEGVERDLADLNVTRDLVERQESILSHLLDAQRSVQQRGFKEQRESEGAKPFAVGTSPLLPEDRGERNRVLREELMRALKQGNLGDYEQLVRRYFERLLEAP